MTSILHTGGADDVLQVHPCRRQRALANPQYINCGNSNCPRNLPPQPPPIAPTSQPKVEKRRGLGNGEGRVLFQPPHSGSEPAKEAK
ncbi:hypothetical protein B0H10DRAFT_2228225 [Mycena sp. CBHHK59/15]|nr:hypothetical protein B0H10DRAFT_2228225 [Mycena sp. CBHHK59/15]